MSEYMEKHAVARLIGAPPGYVGYDEGGQLTEAVRRRPHAVVLFDEIEKAHPEVFNVLLQILDDGRLTDAQGRTVDFRNVVVLMTSNIGSQDILDAGAEAEWEGVEDRVRGQLHHHFRPEFLNRVDDIVVFRPLGQAQLARIVDIQLERVAALAAELGVSLDVADSARAFLAAAGYDPVFGARPLKRAIQRYLQDPLAMLLLDEEVAEGTTIPDREGGLGRPADLPNRPSGVTRAAGRRGPLRGLRPRDPAGGCTPSAGSPAPEGSTNKTLSCGRIFADNPPTPHGYRGPSMSARRLALLALLLVAPAACSTRTVEAPPPAMGAQLSVERFLQAANQHDVVAMGNLFGTSDGP